MRSATTKSTAPGRARPHARAAPDPLAGSQAPGGHPQHVGAAPSSACLHTIGQTGLDRRQARAGEPRAHHLAIRSDPPAARRAHRRPGARARRETALEARRMRATRPSTAPAAHQAPAPRAARSRAQTPRPPPRAYATTPPTRCRAGDSPRRTPPAGLCPPADQRRTGTRQQLRATRRAGTIGRQQRRKRPQRDRRRRPRGPHPRHDTTLRLRDLRYLKRQPRLPHPRPSCHDHAARRTLGQQTADELKLSVAPHQWPQHTDSLMKRPPVTNRRRCYDIARP